MLKVKGCRLGERSPRRRGGASCSTTTPGGPISKRSVGERNRRARVTSRCTRMGPMSTLRFTLAYLIAPLAIPVVELRLWEPRPGVLGCPHRRLYRGGIDLVARGSLPDRAVRHALPRGPRLPRLAERRPVALRSSGRCRRKPVVGHGAV